jgi:hypothetical protein
VIGVDTYKDTHTAAVGATGAVLEHLGVPADPAGYRRYSVSVLRVLDQRGGQTQARSKADDQLLWSGLSHDHHVAGSARCQMHSVNTLEPSQWRFGSVATTSQSAPCTSTFGRRADDLDAGDLKLFGRSVRQTPHGKLTALASEV